MDGIHDLGGMHGFGAVEVERDEPTFHARWEGRVFALSGIAIAGTGRKVDKFRHAIERLDPVTYLVAGYYGRWLRAIETLLVEAGALDAAAVERRARFLAAGGVIAGGGAETAPSQDAPGQDRERATVRRATSRVPRFRPGDAVRARNLHPPGHTRLPRYARGKRGRIEAVYDAYVFPDTNAHDRGEHPQHVYSVAFGGEELWGADAEPGTLVHLDLFETYLEALHE